MAENTVSDLAEWSTHTGTAEATQAIARRLGALLHAGDLVALIGPLGAGKTCFVQGLAEGLGLAGPITSPTFVLMRLHRGATALSHVDAYRIDDAEELFELGLDDWLRASVVAIEWADTVEETLPHDRLIVQLDYDGEGRQMRLVGLGSRPAAIVERMVNHASGD